MGLRVFCFPQILMLKFRPPVEAARKIRKYIDEIQKDFPDLHFQIMGEAEEGGKMVDAMLLAFFIALIAVFCILASSF